MNNNLKKTSKMDDKRRNMMSGMGIGAALGVVFWSALDGLLPFPFDLLAGMSTGFLIGYQLSTRPPALMHYPAFVVRRILFTGMAAILGMFGYLYLLDLDLNKIQRLLSSLAAIIPALAFVAAIAFAIGQLDEMQRRIQIESITIAFAGTAIAAVIFTLLGFAGVPSPDWIWLLVVMMSTWLIGKAWTMRRYWEKI